MKILLFGIAKDIVGDSTLQIDKDDNSPKNVGALKQYVAEAYPKFDALSSLAVAVNSAYAEDDVILQSTDEIALIPPVSGG